ncbi:hypothetical protein A3A11_01030 [Candidatus Nomurabacteria bacterium RIFCSPLOWO2_01_FULL_43_15]|nr:MAG: hypothetical protein A3A11_01030 [Candidatus Nomurabacteria bacterium RIFCSPLOWO2_01_FULL_43_15]
MRTVTKAFVVLALLLCVGCGNKIDNKLAELEAKPAAATVGDAKTLYKEATDLIRWHEDPQHEQMTPEQLTRAKALQKRRFDEGLALVKDKAASGLSGALGGLGFGGFNLQSIDPSKAIDWFLGVGNPEVDKFTGPDRSPTDQRGAQGWP